MRVRVRVVARGAKTRRRKNKRMFRAEKKREDAGDRPLERPTAAAARTLKSIIYRKIISFVTGVVVATHSRVAETAVVLG